MAKIDDLLEKYSSLVTPNTIKKLYDGDTTPTKKYSTTAPPEPTTPYEQRTSAEPMTTKLKATTGPTSTPQRNKQRQS